MDEQQMINDILDSIYGYDILLKEGDEDTITLKKKEREDKTVEITNQVNNICEDIANELKSILGSDVSNMAKSIRIQVLTSIKAEIDNGNKVIDSDGKISVGKITDIITQSKNEILNIKMKEEEIHPNAENIIEPIRKEETPNVKQEISKNLESFGIKLSDDAQKELEIAIQNVRAFLKVIQEKIDSGMTNNEAIAWYFDQMSEEEKQNFMVYLNIAGRYEIAKLIEQAKGQNPEKTEISAPKDESLLNGGETQDIKKTKENYAGSIFEKRQKNSYGLDIKALQAMMSAVDFGINQRISMPITAGRHETITQFDRYFGNDLQLARFQDDYGLNVESFVKRNQLMEKTPIIADIVDEVPRSTGGVRRKCTIMGAYKRCFK